LKTARGRRGGEQESPLLYLLYSLERKRKKEEGGKGQQRNGKPLHPGGKKRKGRKGIRNTQQFCGKKGRKNTCKPITLYWEPGKREREKRRLTSGGESRPTTARTPCRGKGGKTTPKKRKPQNGNFFFCVENEKKGEKRKGRIRSAQAGL